MNPNNSNDQSTLSTCLTKSNVFKVVAIAITGIDNKKENLTDKDLDRPINSAAVMVIPERDVPGIKAKA
jgi:hypothetical protein